MNHNIPLSLSYDGVLLVPQYSTIKSRSTVDLTTIITPNVTLKLPLISINMSDVTETQMAIKIGSLGGIGFLHRFMSPENQANMVRMVKKKGVQVGAALGIKEGYKKRAMKLVGAGVDILTIDVAHGEMKQTVDVTCFLKNKYGNKVGIISGVIATYDGAKRLFATGADSVRVGVGPGTICKTRIETGVGVPQISAVIEATKASKKHKKTILCDGGTKNSGDVVKGLAAGASAIVMGSQLAGTDESPSKLVTKRGEKYKVYNASTSFVEKRSHKSKLNDIGKSYMKHIEGVESHVPYRGSLESVIEKMEANIKSGFSYCGANNISDLWKKAKFVRITSAGMSESMPHDVVVTD